MLTVKGEEIILKAARKKQRVTYKGVPIRLSADFLKETLQARRDWQEVFKVMKSKDLKPRLSSKAIILNGRADKVLPRQSEATGVHHHQATITLNIKGTYLRKRRSKLWTLKWQKTHNHRVLNLKKNKLSKQPEQEQNHRNEDQMEGYQWGGKKGRMAEKVQE